MGKTKKGGRRRRSAKVDKAAIERAENVAQALQYRRMGYTFTQIAETMNCSPSTAYRWFSEGIKEIPREAAEEVRAQMLDRLDRALQPLMRAIEEDTADSSTVNAMLAIEDRRAKLLGIYRLADFAGTGDDGEHLIGLEALRLELRLARIAADKPAIVLQPGDTMPAGARVLRPDEPGPANPHL